MIPDAVLAAAQRRSAALVDKDVAVLQGLLHPDFVYVNASGLVLDRDQYLDRYVRPDEVQWTSQTIEAPRIVDVGSVAVLTCLVHDVARFRDDHMDETSAARSRGSGPTTAGSAWPGTPHACPDGHQRNR